MIYFYILYIYIYIYIYGKKSCVFNSLFFFAYKLQADVGLSFKISKYGFEFEFEIKKFEIQIDLS